LKPLLRLLVALTTLLPAAAAELPRVFLAGDSTMAEKPLDLPERGWGMARAPLLREGVAVRNHAMNGRSTKSFLNEGRWTKLTAELRPGDFVVIQFAHNDEKREDPKRFTDPATSFRDNLRRFVRETRARGAVPLLATPVCRRKFAAGGRLLDTHGDYPAAVRGVAAEEQVPLLDLERATAAWLQREGDVPSRRFFMWLAPGEHPRIPEGRRDDTHFVAAGAEAVAALAAAAIREQNLPLAPWLRP
jgi:DNA sulfur modification protein DndE